MEKYNIIIFGWGKVANKFYYPQIYNYIDKIDKCFVIEPRIDVQLPKFVTKINENDLPRIFSMNKIDYVFLLTPPTAHFQNVIACLSNKHNWHNQPIILIEKPMALDIPDAMSIIDICKDMRNVRYIDHYILKQPVFYLKNTGYDLLETIGDFDSAEFFSSEINELWISDAFNNGYSVEHGVHAWGVLAYLFPKIIEYNISQGNNNEFSRYWIQEDLKEWTKDSAFSLLYTAKNERRDSVGITISGGKGLKDNIKYLKILWKNCNLKIDFNDGTFEFSDTRINELYLNSCLKIAHMEPYQRLSYYLFENSDHNTVTLPLGIGLYSLENIINAKMNSPVFGSYEKGEDLNHIIAKQRKT